MPSNTEETALEDSGAYSGRCMKVCGILCLVVSTLFFFGNISLIVWLFEYSYPIKFSVVCFMVASGVLYLTSFTSSLLLVTRKVPRIPVTRMNSNETNTTGFTHRDECPESFEMTTNITFNEGSNAPPLPPKPNVRKTPPPPYDANGQTSDHPVSEFGNMGDVQFESGQIRLTNGLPHTARDLERKWKSELQVPTASGINEGFDRHSIRSDVLKMQRNKSPQPKLYYQEAAIDVPQSYFGSNQHFIQQTHTYLEMCHRPPVSAIGTPSTTLKRKLKTSMSKSDLDSDIKNIPSHSNGEMLSSHSKFDSRENLKNSLSNSDLKVELDSQTNKSPTMTPRFLRRSDLRSSQSSLLSPMLHGASQSSLLTKRGVLNTNHITNPDASISNSNVSKQLAPKSNCDITAEKQFVSHQQDITAEQPKNPMSESSDHFNVHGFASVTNPLPDVQYCTSYVKNLKKIFQPEQFVAKSKDVAYLQKARSHGSLVDDCSESLQLDRKQLKSIGETSALDDVPMAAKLPYGTGRFTESVLDASRNSKQLKPQDWMTAWNNGFYKQRTANGERIVGVRI